MFVAVIQTAYAFGPLQWLYAVGAEVFALNNLAAAVLLWLTLRYAEKPSHGRILLGAFTCGVAMTNQHTIVLFEIPIILWILWTQRRVRDFLYQLFEPAEFNPLCLNCR